MNVADLVNDLVSWKTLFGLILLHGFFPGVLLRLLVLGYSTDDPRRGELVAQLYKIPLVARPLWVLEQLETVLGEAIAPRIVAITSSFFGGVLRVLRHYQVAAYMVIAMRRGVSGIVSIFAVGGVLAILPHSFEAPTPRLAFLGLVIMGTTLWGSAALTNVLLKYLAQRLKVAGLRILAVARSPR